MIERLDAAFVDQLVPELRAAGVDIISWDDTTLDERAELERIYESRMFPVLTPLAVDPGHPFPYISDLAHCRSPSTLPTPKPVIDALLASRFPTSSPA